MRVIITMALKGFDMQICIKCRAEKHLSDFYAHPQTALGVSSKCKECVKAYQRNRRITHPEITKNIDHRKYMNRRKAHYKMHCVWVANNPKKMSKYKKLWVQNNKDKIGANNCVQKAVARGDIPRVNTLQCNKCNNQAQEYHHWSYKLEHRLDIEPLCTLCHGLADIERRKMEATQQLITI